MSVGNLEEINQAIDSCETEVLVSVINGTNNYDGCLLCLAAKRGSEESFVFLASIGCQCKCGSLGKSVARGGNIQILQRYLEETPFADDVLLEAASLKTPDTFMWLAINANDRFEALLNRPAVLEKAIEGDSVEIFNYILDLQSNADYEHLLERAVEKGCEDITEYLSDRVDQEKDFTPLICKAIENNQPKSAIPLLQLNFNGPAVVDCASKHGLLDVIKNLSDADVNQVFKDGTTMLMRAAVLNNVEMIEFLIHQGALVNQRGTTKVALSFMKHHLS